MGDFVKVGRKDEIEPGTGKTVDVEGTPVALFNVGGTYYAVHNTCRHRGGPLGEGELSGSVVTCPWHGWQEGDDILVSKQELHRLGQETVEGGAIQT